MLWYTRKYREDGRSPRAQQCSCEFKPVEVLKISEVTGASALEFLLSSNTCEPPLAMRLARIEQKDWIRKNKMLKIYEGFVCLIV
jgi:hypothetical protein